MIQVMSCEYVLPMLKSFVEPMVNDHYFSFIVFAFPYKN